MKRAGETSPSRRRLPPRFPAARGVTGPRDVFEGRFGFFHLYDGGRSGRAAPGEARQSDGAHEYSHDVLARELGLRFEVENLSFKPYPCCRASHGVLGGLLEIMRAEKVGGADVERAHPRAGGETSKMRALLTQKHG